MAKKKAKEAVACEVFTEQLNNADVAAKRIKEERFLPQDKKVTVDDKSYVIKLAKNGCFKKSETLFKKTNPFEVNATTLMNDDTFKKNTEIYAKCYRKGDYHDTSEMVNSAYREKLTYRFKQWVKIHKQAGDFRIKILLQKLWEYIVYLWYRYFHVSKKFYGYNDLTDMMESTGGLPYKGLLTNNGVAFEKIIMKTDSPFYQLQNFMNKIDEKEAQDEEFNKQIQDLKAGKFPVEENEDGSEATE